MRDLSRVDIRVRVEASPCCLITLEAGVRQQVVRISDQRDSVVVDRALKAGDQAAVSCHSTIQRGHVSLELADCRSVSADLPVRVGQSTLQLGECLRLRLVLAGQRVKALGDCGLIGVVVSAQRVNVA
ncbi:hypothetical protein S8c_00062 [Klebsiella phage VLCpiS8c]|nr:hypothetical protein S8c_00062 [Klebsiella phage VLCpiS8c]